MSLESHHAHASAQSSRKARIRGLLCGYKSLLDEERPLFMVARTSPFYSCPFPECQTPNPLTSLRLWLNRPLLTLLNKRAGEFLGWSPIWWKDDAEPYGRIMLRRDQPRGRRRTYLIEDGVYESVSISSLGDRKAQLWFPVAAITHYAVTQFNPLSRGIVFNPLDGFQMHNSKT